jgi:hypothetical protein
VTANFIQAAYTLSISSTHGTVTPDLPAPYHYGDVVHLSAVPDLGWTFSDWSGDATGSTNPLTLTIDGNKTLTANYLQNGYSLTLISTHGTLTKDPDQAAYTYGQLVQLSANPDSGWLFDSWSGDASGSANPTTLTMDGNKTLTANYIAITSTAQTLLATSTGAYDGWVLESGETSSTGGTKNTAATTFRIGDDSNNRQYRAILSFDTTLPPGAVISQLQLQILQAGKPAGANPFLKLGSLLVDVKSGQFGKKLALELGDFRTPPTGKGSFVIANAPLGGWYTGTLGSQADGLINKLGVTQLRLRFAKDDNNNRLNNYLKFYAGNFADPTFRPVLIITYTLP